MFLYYSNLILHILCTKKVLHKRNWQKNIQLVKGRNSSTFTKIKINWLMPGKHFRACFFHHKHLPLRWAINQIQKPRLQDKTLLQCDPAKYTFFLRLEAANYLSGSLVFVKDYNEWRICSLKLDVVNCPSGYINSIEGWSKITQKVNIFLSDYFWLQKIF